MKGQEKKSMKKKGVEVLLRAIVTMMRNDDYNFFRVN